MTAKKKQHEHLQQHINCEGISLEYLFAPMHGFLETLAYALVTVSLSHRPNLSSTLLNLFKIKVACIHGYKIILVL
jgi:hypothetical protein